MRQAGLASAVEGRGAGTARVLTVRCHQPTQPIYVYEHNSMRCLWVGGGGGSQPGVRVPQVYCSVCECVCVVGGVRGRGVREWMCGMENEERAKIDGIKMLPPTHPTLTDARRSNYHYLRSQPGGTLGVEF